MTIATDNPDPAYHPEFLAVQRRDPARTGVLGRFVMMFAAAAISAILGFAAVAVWALQDVPLGEIFEATRSGDISPYPASGRKGERKNPFLTLDEGRDAYPQHLVNAVISIEDRRFYQHGGLDFLGISRALVRNVAAGKVVEGGSTITQQWLKIRYLHQERTLKRKIQEAILAPWIETRLSKRAILELYLDNVYLGAGAKGMRQAAQVYFGKRVGDLTLAEAAMLAGLIQAPSRLNPLENPQAARQRSLVVLAAMRDADYIDASRVPGGGDPVQLTLRVEKPAFVRQTEAHPESSPGDGKATRRSDRYIQPRDLHTAAVDGKDAGPKRFATIDMTDALINRDAVGPHFNSLIQVSAARR